LKKELEHLNGLYKQSMNKVMILFDDYFESCLVVFVNSREIEQVSFLKVDKRDGTIRKHEEEVEETRKQV
jgi:hypothetical protein